ncbi:MAG: glutamate--tRNA ligase [Planctomycetes bacterium]|nr:glutamate--tRNA ligase [Planctomycetota bacterium]
MDSARTAVVRTRFAPSPTGYLHIGGARTALFNFLVARRLGGKFILRIEDTDQTRNVAGAESKLMADLRWLGLQWDEGPGIGGPANLYRQSERLESYRAAARKLLDAGAAYYAFDTREELDAMRAAAVAAKRNFRYPRPARLPSDADADAARAAGRPVVIRLRMPDQDFVVRDQILGDVTIRAEELDDFVLVKADGWPTYHFAVVVDDEAMLITHVLRGQEHLMNTPNHLALQQALGYHTPVYAHLPIILNMNGSKMSKREKDKAVRAAAKAALDAGKLDRARMATISGAEPGLLDQWLAGETQLESDRLLRLAHALHVQMPEIEIHDFRASGYLPDVLLNFIALLGWNPGDDREKMTLDEMASLFEIERIGKTNARFDRAKLLNFNTTALAAADLGRKVRGFGDYLDANPDSPFRATDDATRSRLLAMHDGIRTFADVETKSGALFAPDDAYPFDADAVEKNLRKGDGAGLRVLTDLRDRLDVLTDWSTAAIEATIRNYGDAGGLGLGKLAQPLRVAVTGGTISPPIFDTLAFLGKQRAMARIGRAIRHVGA